MISEIDLLREDIPRLEQKFGANHLFVEVLKAQLASLQNPTASLSPTLPLKARVLGLIRSLIANSVA